MKQSSILRMRLTSLVFLCLLSNLCLLTACVDSLEKESSAAADEAAIITKTAADSALEKKAGSVSAETAPLFDYERLRQKITYGEATAVEVRNALTETDVAALSNTMHALFSMRWHRVIVHILDDMWKLDKNKYPELAWQLIETAPVRIALASTINRIQVHNTQEYKDYIRAHQEDEHEFHRAQVVIALGLNQDPADVPYLQKMAEGDNHYVAQSAITSLALMHSELARDAMVATWRKYKEDARGDLILDVLEKAYDWVPYVRTKTDQAKPN